MRILILEDSDERIARFEDALSGHNVTVCKAVKTAIGELYDGVFDYIFLDYDLGEGNKNGAEVALYLSMSTRSSEQVIIHSMNPMGQDEMHALLPGARVVPFSILIKELEGECLE